MPSPLNLKRPKQASLIQELLVGAVILLPLIYLFYLYRNGTRYHFSNPTINLMGHMLFYFIPIVWIKILFGKKLEFNNEPYEISLDQQSTLLKLKHSWWMMLMVWSAPILCLVILASESHIWLSQGIPDFSSSPGSLFWTIILVFSLGFFYLESIRSGYVLTVSENGVRTGISSFCEWDNIDHVVCQGDSFSIYHKSCKYLPFTGFKLSDDNLLMFKAYLNKHNVLTTDRHNSVLIMIQLCVIVVTLFIVAIGFYLYDHTKTDFRWLIVGVFVVSIVATMILEKIRGISKISKIKPRIEEAQREALKDRIKEFPAAPIAEITSEREEDGFIDLVFGISRLCVENNVQTINVVGTSAGRKVGFSVELGSQWKSGGVGDLHISSGIVRIASTGDESDSFVRALAQVYEVDSPSGQMSKNVEFTAVSLGGNPADIENGPVKLKLFFEPDGDGYAEVYANFDLAAKKFYFNEKDPEYRPFILSALSKKT